MMARGWEVPLTLALAATTVATTTICANFLGATIIQATRPLSLESLGAQPHAEENIWAPAPCAVKSFGPGPLQVKILVLCTRKAGDQAHQPLAPQGGGGRGPLF